MVKGVNRLPQVILLPPHTHTLTAHLHTYTHVAAYICICTKANKCEHYSCYYCVYDTWGHAHPLTRVLWSEDNLQESVLSFHNEFQKPSSGRHDESRVWLSLCLLYRGRALRSCPSWPWACHPSASTSRVFGVTGLPHQAQMNLFST